MADKEPNHTDKEAALIEGRMAMGGQRPATPSEQAHVAQHTDASKPPSPALQRDDGGMEMG